MTRIVMRPMDDRQTSGIVHHLAADLDRIAGSDGATRCDPDVIDDFDSSGAALNVERFVYRARARTEEEVRIRRNRSGEVDPCGRRSGVCGSQVHRRSHHARPRERLVAGA